MFMDWCLKCFVSSEQWADHKPELLNFITHPLWLFVELMKDDETTIFLNTGLHKSSSPSQATLWTCDYIKTRLRGGEPTNIHKVDVIILQLVCSIVFISYWCEENVNNDAVSGGWGGSKEKIMNTKLPLNGPLINSMRIINTSSWPACVFLR